MKAAAVPYGSNQAAGKTFVHDGVTLYYELYGLSHDGAQQPNGADAARGQQGEAAEKFQQYWVGQSRALTDKSTRGKFVFVEGSSHFIYLDVPGLVVESVLSIVQESRTK